MNGLELNELEFGESYKYLGQDEDISYKGELNKERVVKEYYRRVRKIWKSELYSKNNNNTSTQHVCSSSSGPNIWRVGLDEERD